MNGRTGEVLKPVQKQCPRTDIEASENAASYITGSSAVQAEWGFGPTVNSGPQTLFSIDSSQPIPVSRTELKHGDRERQRSSRIRTWEDTTDGQQKGL